MSGAPGPDLAERLPNRPVDHDGVSISDQICRPPTHSGFRRFSFDTSMANHAEPWAGGDEEARISLASRRIARHRIHGLPSATGPTVCPAPGGLDVPDLEVGVHQFATAHPQGVRITLCVAGRCSPTVLIRPTTFASNVDGLSVGDPSRPTEITLTAIDAATGRTILRLR
jgi:hypothetical protein